MGGFKNSLSLNMFLKLRKKVRDLPPTVGYVTGTPTATLYATGLPVRWPAKQGDLLLADKADLQM